LNSNLYTENVYRAHTQLGFKVLREENFRNTKIKYF
jgi:hypothetical protein